eukprot:3621717-Pyramimonas_sp.AAC.1
MHVELQRLEAGRQTDDMLRLQHSSRNSSFDGKATQPLDGNEDTRGISAAWWWRLLDARAATTLQHKWRP